MIRLAALQARGGAYMEQHSNMVFKSIRWQLSLVILVTITLTGCESAGYYAQAVSGQISVLNAREPISRLLSDPDIPSRLKDRLRLVLELREFSRDQLHLPIEDHYLTYADLKRSYALWNVYAAPEFTLAPKTWCYPIIGCAAYRGYFSKQTAVDYADRLKGQGYDVFVGGVAAYSTLGWFDDPVLNTFVYRSRAQLAALIFHELAHQVLYIPDDTMFNESFATAVEQEGLRRWFSAKNDPSAFDAYKLDHQRRRQFIQLIVKCRDRLHTLYGKKLPVPEKRSAKEAVFADLKEDYKILKQDWNGHSRYDAWFSNGLNNAKMITVSTYYDLVPAFSALLQSGGNDLESFYRKCRDLSKKDQQERRDYLHR
ncbi:MAG: aminopeptidase [Desulfobacterales bacterium]